MWTSVLLSFLHLAPMRGLVDDREPASAIDRRQRAPSSEVSHCCDDVGTGRERPDFEVRGIGGCPYESSMAFATASPAATSRSNSQPGVRMGEGQDSNVVRLRRGEHGSRELHRGIVTRFVDARAYGCLQHRFGVLDILSNLSSPSVNCASASPGLTKQDDDAGTSQSVKTPVGMLPDRRRCTSPSEVKRNDGGWPEAA